MKPELGGEEKIFFLVCSTLIRKAISHGRGLNVLLHEREFEPGYALLRAIYELSIDLRYILRSDSRTRDAIKAHVSALIEIFDFTKMRDEPSQCALTSEIGEILDEWQKAVPEILDEVRKQRKKRRFHFSGQSRSKLERDLVPGAVSYKIFSWATHSTLAPVTDVAFGNTKTELRFEPLTDETDEIPFLADTAGALLYYMWNEYAETFRLEMVDSDKLS